MDLDGDDGTLEHVVPIVGHQGSSRVNTEVRRLYQMFKDWVFGTSHTCHGHFSSSQVAKAVMCIRE